MAEIKDLFKNSPVLALDYETSGLWAHDPEQHVVCLGLADKNNAIYYQTTPDSRTELYLFLQTKQLVMHNASFDAAWYYRESGMFPNIKTCTSALFKYLATEGWTGQRWTLKVAMLDILGWDEPNTEELYGWVRSNKLKKEDMHKAPMELLGPYCAADADATFQLWTYFETFRPKFPKVFEYMKEQFIPICRLVIAQQMNGILIDRDKLSKHLESQEKEMEMAAEKFFQHPDISPAIAEYNNNILADQISKEPPKLTKPGKVSARWTNWQAKVYKFEWINHFNINSKTQLKWLFFTKLGFIPTKFTKNKKKKVASLDKDVLPSLGESGLLLLKYNKLVKNTGYIKACLILSERDGVLHYMVNMPGTVTGRLSGGSENDD